MVTAIGNYLNHTHTPQFSVQLLSKILYFRNSLFTEAYWLYNSPKLQGFTEMLKYKKLIREGNGFGTVRGPVDKCLPFAFVQMVSCLSQQPVCGDSCSLDAQHLDAWKDALGAGTERVGYALVSSSYH